MKGIFTGDWHLDLRVEDLDRTDEADAAITELVDYAIENEVDFVSIAGDPTDTNTPHNDIVARLMRHNRRLDEANIVVIWSLGNHEAVSIAGRTWGLSPLQEAGYLYTKFVFEPKLLRVGNALFLFLPHITRATAVANGYETPQAMLDARAAELLEAADKKVIVVSHHNVDGARSGTEQYMLRQNDMGLPGIVRRSPKVIQIFNSHIHTPQEIGKLVMPGSLICTDFGDVDENKGFIVAEIDGGKCDWKRVRTKSQSPLHEFELDFTGKSVKERKKLVDGCRPFLTKDAIVKVRVLVEEERLPEIDFGALQAWFAERSRFVKTIDRVVSKTRHVRDRKQVSTLAPVDAVKRYIETRKPDRAKHKLDLALRIMKGEVVHRDLHKTALRSRASVEDALDETAAALEASM